MQTLEALLAGLDATWRPGEDGADIRSIRPRDISEDSRRVTPGCLFVARSGLRSDGGAFVEEAKRLGACAVLTDRARAQRVADRTGLPAIGVDDVPRAGAEVAERFFDHPSRALDLIGVTGTNGKTTVAHLVQRILRACGVECGLIGTVVVDTCRAARPATLTTPPAIEISRALAAMRAAGAKACAIEASSHALEQGRIGALRFCAGVYTNLSGDHLDYHATMEAYAGAKRTLFDALGPDAEAIVNIDDAWADRVTGETRARRVECSERPGAACTVRTLDADARSTLLALDGPWGAMEARARLVGAHNAMNLLQALAGAWGAMERLGAAPDRMTLEQAARSAAPPPGRLEPVALDDESPPFSVLVDYAHTDHALEHALRAARGIVADSGKLLVVFGCGGDRDRTKRPRMGRIASELADAAVVTSDNPRTEDPRAIIDEIMEGVPPQRVPACEIEPDRAAAIAIAIERARPGDVVLIAGKGHEDYQLLPDGAGGVQRRPFDDRVEARAALTERRRRIGAIREAGAA